MLVLWGSRYGDVQAGSREDMAARLRAQQLADWVRLRRILAGRAPVPRLRIDQEQLIASGEAVGRALSRSFAQLRSGGRVRVGERV